MQQVKLIALLTVLIFSMTPNVFAQTTNGWQNQHTKVKGTWSIEQRADGNYVTLSDDFKTRNAPDLKIFLSKNNADSLTGSNATNNSVLVAKLSSSKGAQSYKIPENINVADYESLLIHCEQYSKLWAATPLQ
ncbi:MAG: DM13 domain-containing protein [Pseudomonadota bacterium]